MESRPKPPSSRRGVTDLCKHGSLQVRPCAKDDTVEYLVLALNYYVNQVYIYRRHMSKELEVYDMRAA